MFASLMKHPDWSPTFAPNGTLLLVGDRISRPALARTLYTIASKGASALYTGPIAHALVAKAVSTGGILTIDDLAGYEIKVAKALQGTYFGRNIYLHGAPTSGPALIQMLNLMERYEGLREEGRTGVNVHRSVEAMKCAFAHSLYGYEIKMTLTLHYAVGFAARTHIGDLSFLSPAQQRFIEDIPSKPLAALVSLNMTDDVTHPPEYYNPEYGVLEDHGTSHSSIVDEDGMAVSITSRCARSEKNCSASADGFEVSTSCLAALCWMR